MARFTALSVAELEVEVARARLREAEERLPRAVSYQTVTSAVVPAFGPVLTG